jgi:hypothetical protein
MLTVLCTADSYTHRANSLFNISPLPSIDQMSELLSDILHQAYPHNSSPSLDDPLPKDGKLALAVKTTLHDFERQWKKLVDENDWDVIVITTSSSCPSSSSSNIFGTYSLPNTHSLLHKREDKEKPLEVEPTEEKQKQKTTTKLGPLASSPLPGILPSCFPSMDSCNSLTRNCTGHGSCNLKYTDPSARDGAPNKHCYVCSCEPQKHETSDGKEQTTYWGGAACQKKDVSVEFWLIVLFTVALIGLVGFAVGSVWSMGDEELPSVIGAGVSGPVARR